jgi:hypothetical protein
MEKSFYRSRLNKKETHIQFGDDDCVCIGGFLELDYGD